MYVTKLLKDGEIPTIHVQNSDNNKELLANLKEIEKASGKKFITKEFPAAAPKSRNKGLIAPSRTYSATIANKGKSLTSTSKITPQTQNRKSVGL